MAHTYTNILLHMVFSTKNRALAIDSGIESELHGYLGGVLRSRRCTMLKVGGTEDHVHLLTRLSPALGVGDAIRLLKSNSSKWVHEEWPPRRAFAWQTGYGAFSVSHSRRDHVKQYIEDQKRHHESVTFQEEFLALLERHGIDYDTERVWD
jgi:REP element-mobilizing transposase RayT